MSNNSPATSATSTSVTSLHVFREFLEKRADGSCDASRIHSQECYHRWLAIKGAEHSTDSAKKYQRALSNHLSGVDGRSAFEREEEAAILAVLRVKQCWPCFSDREVGKSGFRARGFHEKSEGGGFADAPPSRAPAAAAAAAASAGGGGGGATRAGNKATNKKAQTTTTPSSSPPPPATRIRLLSSSNSPAFAAASAAAAAASSSSFYYSPLHLSTYFPSYAPPPLMLPAAASSYVLPPPPPAPPAPAATAAVEFDALSMANKLAQHARSFPTFNEEAWNASHQAFRLMMLARPPVCAVFVTPDYAQKLCDIVHAHKNGGGEGGGGGGVFVNVVDFTAKDYAKRVVGQNAHSVELFGNMVAGFDGTLLHPKDVQPYLHVALLSLQHPGQEFTLPGMHLPIVNGGQQDNGMWYVVDATLAMDPQSFLYVYCGRVVGVVQHNTDTVNDDT